MLNLNTKRAEPPRETYDEHHARWMATVVHRGFTNQQLSDAFDIVKHHQHWKFPIDKVIDTQDVDELYLISSAIGYYAGGQATFDTTVPGKTRVRAPGYYALIGA
jgi:hypothetical protein